MMRAAGLALALVLAWWPAAASRAAAALEASPLALDVAPSPVRDGEPVTLRLTWQGGNVAGVHDLYIVWALGERAAFLAPDGTWSPRPVPFRAGVAAGADVTAAWSHPGPPGDVPLALLVVAPGAPPLDRARWRFRPAQRGLVVLPARPSAGPPWSDVLPLIVAAALASALVLGLSRSRPL